MPVSQNPANRQTVDQNRRNNLRRKNQRLLRKSDGLVAALEQSRDQLQIASEQLRRQELDIASQQAQIDSLRQQLDQQNANTLSAFNDPNIFGHRFAASMVALCANLANIMPFRTVSKALQVILPTLGIDSTVPDRETICRWCKRLGLDRLQENQRSDRFKDRSDVIWIVDHSNQIGTEKVLVILGISASELPEKGETLALDALEVLAIEPGESWTRDDVRRVYRKLAESIGSPRWVLCDGAVELRESVDVLGSENQTTEVLRDFKHVAANRFESWIGKSEDFLAFLSAMGKTRCLVQQTELAHLVPPGLKTKARFMNIEPVITWAEMVLGVLENPEAPESGVQDCEKLEKRMGWLRDYRERIGSWKRCCEVIGWSLHWINTQGLESNTAEQMREGLHKQRKDRCDLSDQMAEALLEFVDSSSEGLKMGERCWLSSECLESVFGLFKRREGQQSRSGFTGLITSLPTVMRTWSASEVRVGLRRTSLKEVTLWVGKRIGPTLWSKRTQALRRFGPAKSHDFQVV